MGRLNGDGAAGSDVVGALRPHRLEPVFEECLRDLVAILALDHSDQPTA